MGAQTPDPEKPVPILSESAGYFTNVTGGQAHLNPKTSPVLLLPIGDRWLIESRGEFEGDFRRTAGTGAYAGPVNKHLLRAKDRSKVEGWSLLFKPGTQQFLLTAPDVAGDYEVVCTVICSEDHEGMHMKLVVLPKGS